jgi:hypothetical protein
LSEPFRRLRAGVRWWILPFNGRGGPTAFDGQALSLGIGQPQLVGPNAFLAPADLRRQREPDATRQRRSFDLHAQLAEPLRDWYKAFDALEPGRVFSELPPSGVPQSMPISRDKRSDVALLDRLVSLLLSWPRIGMQTSFRGGLGVVRINLTWHARWLATEQCVTRSRDQESIDAA